MNLFKIGFLFWFQMAETVKKSRIVSEDLMCDLLESDSTSLQDIINEEFNQRLKSMSNVCTITIVNIYKTFQYFILNLCLLTLFQ